ncbi:Gfo/Idh/MocA family protein [Haloarchaeobius sp. DFWS5]|uniref:Gfo/Idh/MocA family protein n=1 Tax=Haloarchaeobius sp. DFWS5 TaxID=3446114 RepID=UPI003EC07FE9
MRTHRIAIAGIGSAAETHARGIDLLDDVELVAGSCRTESKGVAFADEFDCEWYPDTESMLDAETPDVLSVCTPSGAHLTPTLAAAERGVDVLCEKPLEITAARIDRMVDAATTHGIRLGGIFQRRYIPLLQTVRSAVEDGRFGTLSVATASVPWWRDDDYYEGGWQGIAALDGGGATMTQAIHAVDAIQWLAAAGMDLEPEENPVAEVFAYTDTRAHDGDAIEVEDTAVASLRYRDGTLGQLLATTSTYPGSAMEYRIAGRDGTVEIRDDELTTWRFRDSRPDDESIRTDFGPNGHGGDAPDPLETANIRAFLDARRTGEPFMLDHQEARKAVEIVEAIYESTATNQPVAIPSVSGGSVDG